MLLLLALGVPIAFVDRYDVKVPNTLCFVLWCVATIATGMMTALEDLILTFFSFAVSRARGRPTAPGSDNALRPPRATVVSPPKRD